MAETSTHRPLKIALKLMCNILLVVGLDSALPNYFSVFGGWPAFIVVGALLTVMNMVLRPILVILTLPLKAFATLLTIVAVNGLFLWIIYRLTLLMDPNLILMIIGGGLTGWIVISLMLGFANWVMKIVIK